MKRGLPSAHLGRARASAVSTLGLCGAFFRNAGLRQASIVTAAQGSGTLPAPSAQQGRLGSGRRPSLVHHLSTIAQSRHSSAVRQDKGLPKTNFRLLVRGVNLATIDGHPICSERVAMGGRGMGMSPCSLQWCGRDTLMQPLLETDQPISILFFRSSLPHDVHPIRACLIVRLDELAHGWASISSH